MIRTGVVSAANPARSNSTAIVQVQLDPLSGCGSCASAGGCGVQWLPAAKNPVVLDCRLSVGASVDIGDQVQVQLPEPDSGWLRIVGYAYGLPTLGMVFGALAGYWLAIAMQMPQSGELFSLAGFVAGLAGGLIAWSRAEKSVRNQYVDKNRLEIASIIQER